MKKFTLSISKRLRSTPFTTRVVEAGVKSYTIYNHMLLPTVFDSLEFDYWHLCQHVQVWDVSAERQVEIKGPDTQKLVQLMTPRNISKAQIGQCFYMPLCAEDGGIINDPIGLKHADDHWWLSIADSDVLLWAKGLATGFGLDVTIGEPQVWPLAVQGPKAEQLVARLFGDEVKGIRFFRFKHLDFNGHSLLVARSGWSKQGGFEIYVNDEEIGAQLWDELFKQGEDLHVRPGCPNLIERIESGFLSYGNDMGMADNPFECDLGKYVSLDADIDSLSIKALRQIAKQPNRAIMGVIWDEPIELQDRQVYCNGRVIGEITSQVFSERYQRHLGYAMCDSDRVDYDHPLTTLTHQGEKVVTICPLPFNFGQLNIPEVPRP